MCAREAKPSIQDFFATRDKILAGVKARNGGHMPETFISMREERDQREKELVRRVFGPFDDDAT